MTEQWKKREYNSQILKIEKKTFALIVFSATGGMGRECSIFVKRLCFLISINWKELIKYDFRLLNFYLLYVSIIAFKYQAQLCNYDL